MFDLITMRNVTDVLGITEAKPTEVNGSAFDMFTALHAASGFAAGKAGVPLIAVVFAAAAFEVLEDRLKNSVPWYFPHPSIDTKVNSLMDVLAVVAGAYVGGSK